MTGGKNLDKVVRQLRSIAKLDGNICVADGNLLFYSEAYRSADSALMSMSGLQCLATTTVTSKHNLLYIQELLYQLVVFLLTLPVTSASRERAHSKVVTIESSVRSGMTSERLEVSKFK